MTLGHYILDERGEPVLLTGDRMEVLMKWANWMEDNWTTARQVAFDEVSMSPSIRVSTIFLGLDHGFGREGPILWETVVFGGPLNEEQDRCGGSREQAEAMHARWCDLAKCGRKIFHH